MAVAASPVQRALRRMPAGSAGTGSCRQDGGLGCPGGAQPHTLWAGTITSHYRSKLMPPLPASHPLLAPPQWPPGREPGGRPVAQGHRCLSPAPGASWGRGGWGQQPALPHPLFLPDWGRVCTLQEEEPVFKKHSHLQGVSGGVFEIVLNRFLK